MNRVANFFVGNGMVSRFNEKHHHNHQTGRPVLIQDFILFNLITSFDRYCLFDISSESASGGCKIL